jgi:hypothetical protein
MAFHNAKNRCKDEPGPCWSAYAGRGIKFLFTSFENFFMELGPRPSPEHSVDRISPNGNYEVGNVRWAEKNVQAHNKRGVWIVECVEIEPDEMIGELRYRTTATLYS